MRLTPAAILAASALCTHAVAFSSPPTIDTTSPPSSPAVTIRNVASPPFSVKVGPKPPFKPMPASEARNRTCSVKGGASDDSAAIMEAISSCNNGGRVVFAKDTSYTIAKAMDLTKLKHIDLEIQGTIKFAGDASYWSANAFKHGFQDGTSFFQLGGTDVNVYGGGTIDGNGGAYSGKRIILFAVVGLKGGNIANINLRNSPQWFNLIKNSADVVYDSIRITGKNKNTDGWDTLHSNNIVIQNSVINNGDDCVSFKPGSVNIVVQGLRCSGSHGISVGSLGQYKDKVDIVENVIASNITMEKSSNAARIKTWAGHGQMNGVGKGGGGSGRVNNIVFENFRLSQVDSAVEITQCYGLKDKAECQKDPSKVSISKVVIRGFSGTVTGKKKGLAGSLSCSTPSSCSGIEIRDFKVSGGLSCSNVRPSGVSCGAG